MLDLFKRSVNRRLFLLDLNIFAFRLYSLNYTEPDFNFDPDFGANQIRSISTNQLADGFIYLTSWPSVLAGSGIIIMLSMIHVVMDGFKNIISEPHRVLKDRIIPTNILCGYIKLNIPCDPKVLWCTKNYAPRLSENFRVSCHTTIIPLFNSVSSSSINFS